MNTNLAGLQPLPNDLPKKKNDDHQFELLLEFFNRSWKGFRKVRKGVKNELDALAPTGFLIIGAHAHLPNSAAQGTPVVGSRLVYRHRD